MDSDVLTKIHRNVSRIYVALESGSQQSDSLRLEHGYAINNVERVLSSEKNRENIQSTAAQVSLFILSSGDRIMAEK